MLAERILRLIEDASNADPGEFDRLTEAARASGNSDPQGTIVGLATAAFEQALCKILPAERIPVLALTPDLETSSSTSQSSLVEHLLENHGAPESLRAFGARGVEIAAGRSWLAARQRDRKPALVVGHSSAMSDLLQTLARRHLKFRLPPGSTALDLVTASESWCPVDLISDSLGGAVEERLFRIYTPLRGVTPFVARDRGKSEPPEFVPPPWTRACLGQGKTATLTIIDLAGLEGAGVEIETVDHATVTAEGFRLA